ncbi:MAG: arylsulfatase A-like enzyme [Planctomycetota bacterium]|jgi:arylsulfatase A-like enzyme
MIDPAFRSRSPHKKTLLGSLVAACALSACGSPEEVVREPTGEEKLVVVVIVDTLRQDALGCYGNETAQTPRIDQIAAEGVRFDQAISASGWTLPSVASILTGTWPSMHKALGKASRLTPITNDLPVAAEVFRKAGYGTLGFANAAFLSPLLGLDRGFDLFDHRHAYNQEIRRADATVDDALLAISERPAEDLFLLVHLFDAHLDYDPPDGYIKPFVGARRDPAPPLSMAECMGLREDKASPSAANLEYIRGLYQGEVAFVDRAIGRLVDGLTELNRWDKTTLVLTSDHGEEFWDHGGFEHGHTLYDELVRVPLIVRTPQSSGNSTHSTERMVRTIDIMPTLFELSGVKSPASFEGKSLTGSLQEGGTPHRVLPAFSQGTLYGAEKLSWRTERYSLILDQAQKGPDAVELYDIQKDPLQLQNIASQEPQVAQELSAALGRFLNKMLARAKTISTPELKDMGPTTIKKYVESLDKLGYTGRDDEEN